MCPEHFVIDWWRTNAVAITYFDVDVRFGLGVWHNRYNGLDTTMTFTSSTNSKQQRRSPRPRMQRQRLQRLQSGPGQLELRRQQPSGRP